MKARLLIVASLLGVVTFFLPYASDTSPLQAIQDGGLWRLAVPFLIPFVAMVAGGLQIQHGNLTTGQRRAVFGWAIATLLVTFSGYIPTSGAGFPSSVGEWIGYLIPLAVAILGALFFVRHRRKDESAGRLPMLALRVAYLPNACMCIYAFLTNSPNIGVYLSIVTTLLYGFDLVT